MYRALQLMREDLQAVFERDPAAKNVVEVVLAYPGLHAIWLHRMAHKLYRRGTPVIPRLISHFSRFVTGIEIHPGARIGRRLFIDHGMGVVIGETTEIGDDVTLYQGVSLAIYHTHDVPRLRGRKRHPTLGNGVTVGVGAKILGAITVGDCAIVGAGSVVTKDVPPHTTVVGIPGRVVAERDPATGERRRVADDTRQVSLPDPELEVIRCLHAKVAELEERIALMEAGQRVAASANGAHGANGRNGAVRPCNEEIERALQASLRAFEGKD